MVSMPLASAVQSIWPALSCVSSMASTRQSQVMRSGKIRDDYLARTKVEVADVLESFILCDLTFRSINVRQNVNLVLGIRDCSSLALAGDNG